MSKTAVAARFIQIPAPRLADKPPMSLLLTKFLAEMNIPSSIAQTTSVTTAVKRARPEAKNLEMREGIKAMRNAMNASLKEGFFYFNQLILNGLI